MKEGKGDVIEEGKGDVIDIDQEKERAFGPDTM